MAKEKKLSFFQKIKLVKKFSNAWKEIKKLTDSNEVLAKDAKEAIDELIQAILKCVGLFPSFKEVGLEIIGIIKNAFEI